jgi:trans-aconitate methyltransferase
MDVVKQLYDRDRYPPFPHIKARRLHELTWLVPRLRGAGRSLLDIGCGDGALVNCLYHLTDLELQACDFAETLMQGVNPRIAKFTYDCRRPGPLPATDIAVIAGVFPYLFEDAEVDALLAFVSAPLLFVRTPCGNDERIDSYSRDLGAPYKSRYRSVDQVKALLAARYAEVSADRVYPDDIESAYGTKQWYFTARR